MSEPPPHRATMIVLAYLWPLALVPLLGDKDDAEVQWHARHGLVLMVVELVLFFGFSVFTTIVSLATLGLGCVFSLLGIFIWIGVVALHVAAILKGVTGKRLIVPWVSAYASRH